MPLLLLIGGSRVLFPILEGSFLLSEVPLTYPRLALSKSISPCSQGIGGKGHELVKIGPLFN